MNGQCWHDLIKDAVYLTLYIKNFHVARFVTSQLKEQLILKVNIHISIFQYPNIQYQYLRNSHRHTLLLFIELVLYCKSHNICHIFCVEFSENVFSMHFYREFTQASFMRYHFC